MWRIHGAVPAVLIVVLGGLTACGDEDQSRDPGGESGQAQSSGDEAADVSASCAAPVTEVSEATVAPGESIVVSAQSTVWDEDGCLGPLNELPGSSPSEGLGVGPETDLPVVWRQGSVESVLATGDANSDGVVELSVTIPDDAQPGTADIVIETAQSATVTVEPPN